MNKVSFSYDNLIPLFMDSQSAIYLANNPNVSQAEQAYRHQISLDKRESGRRKRVVSLLHVSSGEMVADVFTKALATGGRI